jgi:hypothetical protein
MHAMLLLMLLVLLLLVLLRLVWDSVHLTRQGPAPAAMVKQRC